MARSLALALASTLAAVGAVLALVGCGSPDSGAELLTEADTSHTALTTGEESAASSTGEGSTGSAGTAENEGDSCGDAGATASCHAQVVDIDGFRWCTGVRTCDPTSGTWGPCVSTLVLSAADASATSVDGG